MFSVICFGFWTVVNRFPFQLEYGFSRYVDKEGGFGLC